jgi:hypothetical protein
LLAYLKLLRFNLHDGRYYYRNADLVDLPPFISWYGAKLAKGKKIEEHIKT